MSIKYDKYYGVDFAIDLYLQMIKFWKTKQPGVINKTPIVILNNPIMMSRLLVSAWSSQIARTNELYLDMAESEQGIEMQKMIETKLDESELLKRIVPKQTLTSKEIKQQLKNALAHAEYTLATDENGQTIIEIDSPKISGNFTVPEVEELASIYAGDYIILDNKEYCYESSELLTFKINTKVALQNAISNIRYGKSIFDFKIPSCITLLGKMYSGEGKQLTPEEQQIVKDYIQYGGLQNWLKLSDNERGKIFSDRILRIISGRPTYRSSADIISFCLDYLIYRGKGEVSHQQFEKMSFEAPSIYADMLIDLGFLCLNHIKEAQAKQMLQDFNYQI